MFFDLNYGINKEKRFLMDGKKIYLNAIYDYLLSELSQPPRRLKISLRYFILI